MTLLSGTVSAPLSDMAKTLTVMHKLEDVIVTRDMDHTIEVLDAAMDTALVQAHPASPTAWLRCLDLMEQLFHDEIEEARRYWRNEENFWW